MYLKKKLTTNIHVVTAIGGKGMTGQCRPVGGKYKRDFLIKQLLN